MQIGFIGTGEITSSIVTGLSSSGVTAHSIRSSPRNSAIANGLANRSPGISVASCNPEVLDHSDTIVIAVRPSELTPQSGSLLLLTSEIFHSKQAFNLVSHLHQASI
jgi:pyrroline-5-carboxylate reductase